MIATVRERSAKRDMSNRVKTVYYSLITFLLRYLQHTGDSIRTARLFNNQDDLTCLLDAADCGRRNDSAI